MSNIVYFCVIMKRRASSATLFPYTTLFRSILGSVPGTNVQFNFTGDVTVQPGGASSEEHTSELQSRQYVVCRSGRGKEGGGYGGAGGDGNGGGAGGATYGSVEQPGDLGSGV